MVDDATMAGAMVGVLLGLGVFMFVLVAAVYVYSSLALMTIAKKLNMEKPWMAWIPFVNLYLMVKMANVPVWSLLGVLLIFVPFIGPFVLVGLMVWWWWKICENLGKPNWWGILMVVPLIGLVMMGILAWGK